MRRARTSRSSSTVPLDLARHHLAPALVEGADRGREVGEARAQLRNGLREAAPAIAFEVVRRREDVRQEPLHPHLVVEELAEQEARVPAQQDVADVENDVARQFLNLQATFAPRAWVREEAILRADPDRLPLRSRQA